MRALSWLFVCLWPVASLAADVEATLDRANAELGETVTLNLRADGAGMVQPPDLAALSKDFAVLGTSSNTSIRIVNGNRSAQVTIGVALRPLHVGTLHIPSLAFAGGTTAALQLEVAAPDPRAQASGRKDVFLESTVEPSTVYVGQQLMYTLRLYYVSNLTSGALGDPQLPGVDVRPLGNELNYQAERGGRRYAVVERRYAVIPQRDGHMDIPPVGFQGELVDMSDPNGFFGNAAPVSASSPAISIDVRPAPAQAAHAAWLPARELTLKLDGGPAHGELRVGQPLNLVMNLQATGLPYEALPALSLPALDGSTVYPDKPVNGTRVEGQWLAGWRQQGFAIVPNRAGTLTIPETTLTWWNAVADRAEVARIPAQSFTVLPVAGSSVAQSPSTPQTTSSSTSPVAPAMAARDGMPWRLIALASLGLWALSVLGWVIWRRHSVTSDALSVRPEKKAASSSPRAAFLLAARSEDMARQESSLLAWGRAERPGLHNLGELSDALVPGPQRAAIATLQRHRYAGKPEESPGQLLADAFRDGFAWRTEGESAPVSPLPPLYPFKLDH